MMRQLSVATLLTITSLFLSSCGGSSGPGLKTNSPITKAGAVAYAEAVNLGVADMPGFTSTSLEREIKFSADERAYLRCEVGGVKPTRSVANIESPVFTSQDGLRLWQIHSTVEVMPNAALAAQGEGASERAQTAACQAPFLRRAVVAGWARSPSGQLPFKFGQFTITALPSPLPKIAAHETREVVPLTFIHDGRTLHVHQYWDDLGFHVGSADIRLEANGFGSPVPVATEKRLLSLLYERAKG